MKWLASFFWRRSRRPVRLDLGGWRFAVVPMPVLVVGPAGKPFPKSVPVACLVSPTGRCYPFTRARPKWAGHCSAN